MTASVVTPYVDSLSPDAVEAFFRGGQAISSLLDLTQQSSEGDVMLLAHSAGALAYYSGASIDAAIAELRASYAYAERRLPQTALAAAGIVQ